MTEDSSKAKWEYKQLSVRTSQWSFFAKNRDKVVADLNELGLEGWEVAESCVDLGYTLYYILKRPVSCTRAALP
jgi:hypothetical protein